MACVGRTKICSIVPPNHFGPIPGVPVGSAWKFRVQVWLSIYSVVFFVLCLYLCKKIPLLNKFLNNFYCLVIILC